MISTTALLVFSRSASAEAVDKKIFLSARKNLRAATGLVNNVLALASASGLPWYLSDEASQKTGDFGRNLATAIQEIIAIGYKKIMVVGNDCPGLTQPVLQNGIRELESNDWVFGPTAKGGVYMIGITAAFFNASQFEKIEWQTGRVYSQLVEYAHTTGNSYNSLSVLHDINHQTDILCFSGIARSANHLVLLLIDLFVCGSIQYGRNTTKHTPVFIYTTNRRRGPPFTA